MHQDKQLPGLDPICDEYCRGHLSPLGRDKHLGALLIVEMHTLYVLHTAISVSSKVPPISCLFPFGYAVRSQLLATGRSLPVDNRGK
jgi:hypothetical protein